MIVCPMLLREASDVLIRPKLRRFVSADAALELLADIEGAAETHPHPAVIQAISRDLDDDYLVALVTESGADRLVSGDGDLLALAVHDPRIVNPRMLLDELAGEP